MDARCEQYNEHKESLHESNSEPRAAKEFLNLGRLYRDQDNFNAAMEAFAKALLLCHENNQELQFQIHYSMGITLFKEDKLKEALKAYQAALYRCSDKESKATLYHNIGIAYYRTEQWPEAINFFQRAIDLGCDQPLSHYALGLVYFITGKYEQGLIHFKKKGCLKGHQGTLSQVLHFSSWPSSPIPLGLKIDGKTKDNFLNEILALPSSDLKQLALWQALIRKTLLGFIFHLQRGRFEPSLFGGRLNLIGFELVKEIIKSKKIFLNDETRAALQEDSQLQADLNLAFPILVKKMIKQGILSKTKIQKETKSTHEIGFFKIRENHYVSKFIATPEGYKPNPLKSFS